MLNQNNKNKYFASISVISFDYRVLWACMNIRREEKISCLMIKDKIFSWGP